MKTVLAQIERLQLFQDGQSHWNDGQVVAAQIQIFELRAVVEGLVVDAFDQVVVQGQEGQTGQTGQRSGIDVRQTVPGQDERVQVVEGSEQTVRKRLDGVAVQSEDLQSCQIVEK